MHATPHSADDRHSVGRVRGAFEGADPARRRVERRFSDAKVRREARALGRLIGQLGPGARIDVACGTGTLGSTLSQGEVLIGVDSSQEMIAAIGPGAGYSAGLVADAVRLPFAEATFASGSVIRLLHHLDPAGRRAVLAEMRRVVRGPIVASIFDAWTLEAARSARRRVWRGSRRAIPLSEFAQDAAASGWDVGRVARKWWRLTEHVYVLLTPRPGPGSCT